MENETVTAMETILSALAQMGALGIMLAYMMFKENKTTEAHRSERNEWHESSQRRHDEVKKVVETNTEALATHSIAMDKMCDRIERNECKAK